MTKQNILTYPNNNLPYETWKSCFIAGQWLLFYPPPPWPSNTEDHTFERTIKYFNKDLVVTRLQKTNGLPKILALILNSYKRIAYNTGPGRSEVDCTDWSFAVVLYCQKLGWYPKYYKTITTTVIKLATERLNKQFHWSFWTLTEIKLWVKDLHLHWNPVRNSMLANVTAIINSPAEWILI